MALRRFALPSATWVSLAVFIAGATAIVRVDIALRRSQFQAEARTAHRVLSQATARLDAMLATLDLMTPIDGANTAAAEKLPALYPQVLAAWRRDAAARSTAGDRVGSAAVLEAVDGERAQYTLLLPRPPTAYALRVDARRLASPGDWPWHAGDAVRATLSYQSQVIVLHDVAAPSARPFGLTDGFELTKTLASDSQPFVLHAQRFTGPAQWPWTGLAAWLAACAAGLGIARRLQRVRAERRHAAEMLRLAQASRLGMLGELAAGMAHELNQPLTATLAGTQTALRLLRDDDGSASSVDKQTAVQALELASAQARRAADVVGRLREMVRRQGEHAAMVETGLREVARRIVRLLAPELARRAIDVRIDGPEVHAMADPVAVEQILHNLLTNAMQALEARGHGRVTLTLEAGDGHARIIVRDDGPGISDAVAPRLFEPFFSTRPSGLGLGLPLCQTLAMSMQGQLSLRAPSGEGGAEFVLELPVARAPSHAA